MARFSGYVGFVETAETRPGVTKEQATEIKYFGDVLQNIKGMDNSNQVVTDLALQNSVSIIADDVLSEKASAIRYVRWMGAVWRVQTVQVDRPRFILRLGGVWNGPTAAPESP